MKNIFTELINVLNSVQISGESNMERMLYVIQTLHRMEEVANKPEANKPEVNEDG